MLQFTKWLRDRRKMLDLTQAELAMQVGCSLVTIYKIEAGERRPSRQIAERLAIYLEIPPEQRETFVKQARTLQQPISPPPPPFPPNADPISTPNPFQIVPIPPTRLIGRTSELADLAAYLKDKTRRLITLLGPAGVGKTRLSLEIAHQYASYFRDGVCWLTLADIHDMTLITPTITHALNLREQAGEPLHNLLVNALRSREMLLVLDNFEQVIAAAPVVSELLAACPAIIILITSRAPLRVRGEQQFPLMPLILPNIEDYNNPSALAANQAVTLFLERAQSINPNFVLTTENSIAIATLCQRLDGLPLAIELVAGQTRFMPPKSILDQIRPGALDLLTNGPVDVAPRHQSLRNAFDWSYNLLSPPTRQIFATLGVFNGWWSVTAVAAVCEGVDGLQVDQAIHHLIETSLVHSAWNTIATPPQYMLLETIRDYAVERLIQTGQHYQTCERHAIHYCGLAEAAAPHLTGAGQQDALVQIQHNLSNLRVAIAWAMVEAPALAERIGAAMWRFWWVRGDFTEGWSWIKQILDLPVQALHPRATVLNAAGSINLELGDISQAQQYHREALAIWKELNDIRGIALSLGNLGNVARQQQNPLEAKDLYSESLASFRAINHEWGIATTLLNLGTTAEDLEIFPTAQDYYEQSLECYRVLGDKHGVALALANIGGIAWLQGNYDQAIRIYREVLRSWHTLSNYSGIVIALEKLARAFLMQGQGSLAAQICGAAEMLRESLNLTIQPMYAIEYRRTMALMHERLDRTSLEASWAAGRQADLETIIAKALSHSIDPARSA